MRIGRNNMSGIWNRKSAAIKLLLPIIRYLQVYFGGGTPSILETGQIERIMGALRQTFRIEKKAEITLEMNPGTARKEKLKVYRQLGINRLSIGIQSVKNENLKLLGRIHTYEDFLESYHMAREAGFDNISGDLISSLPGQTLEEWKEELEILIRTPLEHLSVYQLRSSKKEQNFMKGMENMKSFCLMRRPAEKSICGRASI